MGFFRTVYTLCTRTSAFPEMLGTPVWKAILHSILLLLICPILLATVQTCREKKDCTDTLTRLEKDSGGFGFRGDEICFGGTFEERHYTFELFDSKTRLDYVTGKEELLRLKPDRWKEQKGLLLTQGAAVFWAKTPDLTFLFWKVPADILKAGLSHKGQKPAMTSRMYAIARDADSKPHNASTLLAAAAETFPTAENGTTSVKPEAPFEKQDSGYIKIMLLLMFCTTLFMQFFAEGLLMFILGGLCFAFMEFLYLRMIPNKLPFGKVYMLTLYAMFPALIVASLATLMGQTFLSFQTVFLIAFFIYQLFSFKALGRFLNPPDKRQQNDFPDDDDF